MQISIVVIAKNATTIKKCCENAAEKRANVTFSNFENGIM